jgi:predicted SprT family Zn-dependent metalloprotease
VDDLSGLSAPAPSVSDMDLKAAHAMARTLLDEHGLTDWTLRFDRAKTRAGVCHGARREIGLSEPLTRLHSEEEVRATVLHEIAHALVGPSHGHDAVWRRQVMAIGGRPERSLDSSSPRPAAPWLGVCPAGHQVRRHRRPERPASCPRCTSGFSLEHLLEWSHHGRAGVMHPNYDAELARLRSGDVPVVLPIGARARITAPGEFFGRVGVVLKRGRTSYHLRLPEGRLRVLFAAVEPP